MSAKNTFVDGGNLIIGSGNRSSLAGTGNVVLGRAKTNTELGVDRMAATTGSTIIGSGSVAVPVPNDVVLIGRDCDPGATVGRLAFGAGMEAVHGPFAFPNLGVPQAYIKVAWDGVLYYVPAFTTVPA